MHLPLRGWVAAEEGRDAEGRRVGAVVTAVRLHRDRQLRPPRHAAARPQWKGEKEQSNTTGHNFRIDGVRGFF